MQLRLRDDASPEAKRLVELTTDGRGNRDATIKVGDIIKQYPELAVGLDEYLKAVEEEASRISVTTTIPSVGHGMRLP